MLRNITNIILFIFGRFVKIFDSFEFNALVMLELTHETEHVYKSYVSNN